MARRSSLPTPPAKVKAPAAANTLAILQLLTSSDIPMSAARIIQETGLPRSTVYHLLRVMEDAGFVVHVAEECAYGLGRAAYEMATSYSRQQPLVRVGVRTAQQLARAVRGSAHISRLSGSEVIYLLEERAPGAVRLLTDAGVRLDCVRTASGRAMVAYAEESYVRAAVGVHGVGGREFADLLRELKAVRERGWAEEKELVSPGQESIAAPIFDHLGRATAALAVTFGCGTLGEEERTRVGEDVRQRALWLGERVYGAGRAARAGSSGRADSAGQKRRP
ncbi:IclR family transcriptional regulator [Corynebacterium uropygiale]|uniref:IclR family transcriptional regulator n=1 Tax=Corynebacterium uropygiale TaxID=1775911 RepID=A0A9X1TZF1_9CORY|nr:IclR family transcriptional regulator [Corynebacterium uropygiale]MCF4005659.1 IclR family transcriptional regulator [Corynebacterium uropygiale]